MKVVLAILLILVWFTPALAGEKPEVVSVYCFSEDLEAGFKDDGAAYFCRQLGKRGEKKKSLVLVEPKEFAAALVQYLGIEKISVQGETTHLLGGYAWTPNQTEDGARAVISIGDFTKGFYGQGVNDVAPMSMMRELEEWIRENRDVILEKAKKQ